MASRLACGPCMAVRTNALGEHSYPACQAALQRLLSARRRACRFNQIETLGQVHVLCFQAGRAWCIPIPFRLRCRRVMKVLVIDEEAPYPLNTGKRIRTWNLLTRLKDDVDITFLSWGHGQAPAELGGIRFLNTGKHLPALQGVRFYASLFGNLASSLPYSVQRHAAVEMQQTFAAVLVGERFDLIHCEWTP